MAYGDRYCSAGRSFLIVWTADVERHLVAESPLRGAPRAALQSWRAHNMVRRGQKAPGLKTAAAEPRTGQPGGIE
jgi:hypothetical protein